MNRPSLEGLFTGNAPADSPMTWLNGQPTVPETPAAPPAPPAPSKPVAARPDAEPSGLFDPVALAERYFDMLQALLDMQREFGLRVAHQVAALPPLNRFRH